MQIDPENVHTLVFVFVYKRHDAADDDDDCNSLTYSLALTHGYIDGRAGEVNNVEYSMVIRVLLSCGVR